MVWPTPQEYNEAIQNTRLCFFDDELRDGTVSLNNLGLPKAITGSFASVYEVTCGNIRYAVRCLLQDIPDQKVRYHRLSKAICSDSLECTVDFEYQAEGIRIDQRAYPIVKMRWVQGDNLDDYVRKHYQNRTLMSNLHDQFRAMITALRTEGFAHGDLQHGNIILSEEGLRLVDYDGMFVPSLSGFLSNELGHRNYQHPARSGDHFGAFLDNFSAWVIDTTLTCLLEDPRLYAHVRSDNEALLFQLADFKEPITSKIYFTLENHESEVVRNASRMLRTVLACLPYNVPPLSPAVPLASELPQIIEKRAAAARALEWANAEEIERKERQDERARRQAETEQRTRLAAELAGKETEKPMWLDDTTANVLGTDQQKGSPTSDPKGVSATAFPHSSPGSASANCFNIATPEEYCQVLADKLHLDPLLASYEIEKLGEQPRNFGTTHGVFHLFLDDKHLALKLFCHEIEKAEDRYLAVKALIHQLPERARRYLVLPEVIPSAVRVNNKSHFGIATEWRKEAVRLDEYLRARGPDFDYTLLSRFRKMMTTLQTARVAHGSLEPSNILVLPDMELLLVDYDNFYAGPDHSFRQADAIPDEYRHPLFSAVDFGPSMDHFQSWLIDTMIMCWSSTRNLWRQHAFTDGGLFFSAHDWISPNKSTLLQDLSQHQQYEIASRGEFLINCLTRSPSGIPPLTRDGMPPGY